MTHLEYLVTVSYIEIYQEKLKDLLRPPMTISRDATTQEKLGKNPESTLTNIILEFKRKTKLEIQESPGDGGIWITNAVRMKLKIEYI